MRTETNPSEETLLTEIRAKLERETAVNLKGRPLKLKFDRGDLLIEGEVASIAAKKRTLEIAGATPGVDGILDRLRVAPSEPMTDGEIRAHVLDALSFETSLAGEIPRIEVRVERGVVTLDGDVPSLTQKRLAELLAWWVPGTRDVVNGLGVEPPQPDSDDEIVNALEVVFAKDPLLKGLGIVARSRRRVVTLVGSVPSEHQREAAENDAWALFGVNLVINEIAVVPEPGG